MKETRYFYVPGASSADQLPDDESQHAFRVLRLKAGDEVMLMDGEGCFFRAELTLTSHHKCCYRLLETLPQRRHWQSRIHIAMAPTKMMERTEWFVEKATEVGIDECSFVDCRYSERRTIKTERIGRIVVAAAKQSRKAWMPQVNGMESFESFVASHPKGRRYIAHCYEEIERVSLFGHLRHAFSSASLSDSHHSAHTDNAGSDDIIVMIGPEGDFSIDEVRMAVSAGFVSVDLGESRLRTETAALAAVMMIHLAQK